MGKEIYLPFIAGLASGLYPWAFYFTNNFNFINSWDHFFFFLTCFIFLPTAVYYVVYFLMRKKNLNTYKKYALPALNILVFFTFLMFALYAALRWKHLLLIIVVTVSVLIVSRFTKNLLAKILVMQFILLFTTIFSFASITYKYLTYNDAWMQQPDAIEQVVFHKTPNVYVIQPDGYVNFSELGKGHYNIDNEKFETFLEGHNFKVYPDFRSNYEATLTSNLSMFVMKHHYYEGSTGVNEIINSRKIIISENPVLKAFNNNGYKTYFLAEKPYLLVNRPKMGFDVVNFSYNEIPFLTTGLEIKKDILPVLKKYAKEDLKQPKFFFVEIFNPKHIGPQTGENLVNKKREEYKSNLLEANKILEEAITFIKQEDPEALIVITADHGGYVGFEYIQQGNLMTEDRDKIHSIFSSVLAIHWPGGEHPEYDHKLKTSVNLFRILFAYLSGEEKYLDAMEKDESYGLILKGAPKGVYKFIDEDGSTPMEPFKLFIEK